MLCAVKEDLLLRFAEAATEDSKQVSRMIADDSATSRIPQTAR